MTAPTVVGHLELPDHFLGSPEQKRTIHQLINSRLPYEVEIKWQLDQQPLRAVFVKVQQCPNVVLLADWRNEIEACKPGEIFIGLDPRRRPYKSSFRTDDPHWGFEVASRRGKSTFLSFTMAQILHQDPRNRGTGIDVKRESFKSLFGVPRFTLSNDPRNIEDMWDKIKLFRESMDQCCEDRDQDPTLEFPYNILMIDEVSQFSAQSAQLWRKIKSKSDPAYPPVWDDIAAVFWQGAAFHHHVVVAGQRVDERITGGIGLIGSMGFRGLAGFRRQNWDRLIGTRPVPRSRPERGRWIYSDGESETWVQNVWATDEEIKDYAMTCSQASTQGSGHAGLMSGGGSWEPAEAGTAWVVGNEAAAAHLGINVEAFRKRRQAREIPRTERKGNKPMWRTTDLDTWASAYLASQSR